MIGICSSEFKSNEALCMSKDLFLLVKRVFTDANAPFFFIFVMYIVHFSFIHWKFFFFLSFLLFSIFIILLCHTLHFLPKPGNFNFPVSFRASLMFLSASNLWAILSPITPSWSHQLHDYSSYSPRMNNHNH